MPFLQTEGKQGENSFESIFLNCWVTKKKQAKHWGDRQSQGEAWKKKQRVCLNIKEKYLEQCVGQGKDNNDKIHVF